MKKALLFFIILSLFSSLFGVKKLCSTTLKMICQKNNIGTCRCVSKTLTGAYYRSIICPSPKKPGCLGNEKQIGCYCFIS